MNTDGACSETLAAFWSITCSSCMILKSFKPAAGFSSVVLNFMFTQMFDVVTAERTERDASGELKCRTLQSG